MKLPLNWLLKKLFEILKHCLKIYVLSLIHYYSYNVNNVFKVGKRHFTVQ